MYSKQGEFVCMLKSVCVHACVHVHVRCTCRNWGEGEGEKGLKSVINMREESRLVLHEIVYGGTGMYPSWHI